jgi:hypothetical protein
MLSSTFLVLAGLAVLSSATPVTPAAPRPQSHLQPIEARQANNSSDPPCAQVSAVLYESGRLPANPIVPAGIAYDCLRSIPFNATSAKHLLAALPPYLEWQSTLTQLANPPVEYAQKVQPPIDILAGLAAISADIDAGKYESEYEFGWSLYTLILSAHDGHFSYVPDSVGAIFTFGREVPLVSVSEDGNKLPSVFAFQDVLGLQFKNISYTPSPVTHIDGQDVSKFLEKLSQYGSLQDRDALYNNVFYELAQVSLGASGSGTGVFTGGGRGRFIFPGDTTTLKFANGSAYTMKNYARVIPSFRNVTDGETLAHRVFYYGTAIGGETPEPSISQGVSAAAAPGYPKPVVPGPVNLINGFFIDAPGYEDVAVLQVPNFVGDSSVQIAFQKTTQQFIPKALAAGKTKLIIDVQANGGGTILQGYDMFKQLFPLIEPVGLNRFRANEALNLIGQSFSAYASQFPRATNNNSTVKSVQSSYFDYHDDMTEDAKPFTSWQHKFGPVEANGDHYTSTHRWNLSDVLITYSSGGINITGYGPLANVSRVPPFKAENVVILTDGYCASTCTIFSELMTKQAGVKTIALGGRSNRNPIQAIGGVKGTNNYQYALIQNYAQNAIYLAKGDFKTQLNSSVLRQNFYDDIVFNRASSSPGVNVRDGLKVNDTSGVALQFIYEPADCRLYYTPEMTVDATAMWKAAADAQWGSNGKCVGSGYGKRDTSEVTKSLKSRRLQVSSAAALKQYEAFKSTFALETQCNWDADGFMHP